MSVLIILPPEYALCEDDRAYASAVRADPDFREDAGGGWRASVSVAGPARCGPWSVSAASYLRMTPAPPEPDEDEP